MKRAALWDLDGTLVDSRADLVTACNAVRLDLGYPVLPEATIVGFIGDGVGLLLSRLLADVPGANLEHARERFGVHYDQYCCERTTAYPGVLELLKRLHAAGWGQAVVTNKPARWAQRIVDALGMGPYIAHLVGGDTTRKPDPTGLQQSLAVLGAQPAHSVMIGDHRTDIAAGLAAGCTTILVTWGMGHDGGLTPDYRVASAQELGSLLLEQ